VDLPVSLLIRDHACIPIIFVTFGRVASSPPVQLLKQGLGRTFQSRGGHWKTTSNKCGHCSVGGTLPETGMLCMCKRNPLSVCVCLCLCVGDALQHLDLFPVICICCLVSETPSQPNPTTPINLVPGLSAARWLSSFCPWLSASSVTILSR
jgi:hypothetical protein